ncbi:hypothetical protein BIW11_06530 [Tropilaelaps mercedesae]|uniref:Uncharacterized protein n=1 Tax=Tropilaelaps mercedesae TaxID=418985 RepID=A0A1V9XXL5_9ACAR|nr:hypothetical protein BIW11_06530 [Tropilaelaps mercedesae]
MPQDHFFTMSGPADILLNDPPGPTRTRRINLIKRHRTKQLLDVRFQTHAIRDVLACRMVTTQLIYRKHL